MSVEGDVERPAGPQSLVDLELGAERLGVDGEALEILVELRGFAILFAEDDLVVDQVEQVRASTRGERDRSRKASTGHPLSAPPALAVILDQGRSSRLAAADPAGLPRAALGAAIRVASR